MLIRDVKLTYATKRVPEVPNPGTVQHAGKVVDILRAWGIDDIPQERFVVVHLNTRHQVIGVQEVGRGSLGCVEIHPREVFRAAVLQGSAAIILAHNHPSGDPTPSQDDVLITKRLKDAGELLGIPVLDHVIVTGERFNAATQNNWMP